MNCNECCESSCSIWIEVLISLVLAAAVGVLFALGFVTNIVTVVWVIFGLAVLNLILLVAGAYMASIFRRSPLARCLCCKGGIFLAGIIGTIVMAIVLLSFTIVVTDFVAALVAILAFFAVLMTVELITFLSCLFCEACR